MLRQHVKRVHGVFRGGVLGQVSRRKSVSSCNEFEVRSIPKGQAPADLVSGFAYRPLFIC